MHQLYTYIKSTYNPEVLKLPQIDLGRDAVWMNPSYIDVFIYIYVIEYLHFVKGHRLVANMLLNT